MPLFLAGFPSQPCFFPIVSLLTLLPVPIYLLQWTHRSLAYCMNFVFLQFSGENTVSSLGRMVLIIWLFVVLIINSSYTASLTSILTVQQLSSSIKGIETLITSNDRIGFQVGSFAENYLSDELDIPKSRLIPLGSPEEYATALENGTVAAVVDERPYIEVFLASHCKFSIVGPQFTRSGWGFVSILTHLSS